MPELNKRGIARGMIALSAALILGIQAAACAPPGEGESESKDKAGTLTIGVKPTDSDAQIIYAQELGYFKEAGLNVKVKQIADGATIVSGVASKSLDIGSANVTSVATSYSEGLPFKFIGAGSMYDDAGPISAALIVGKDSKVKSAADLNGKTVAVNGLKNITDVAVRAWADKNGGDSSKIKFVEFPFPQMSSAVDQGKVDAALNLEPGLSAATTTCCKILGKAYGGIAKNFMTSGWVATDEWIKKNPDEAKKFAEVMAKTAKWANQEKNQKRSAEILVDNLDIEAKTANSMQRAVYGESVDPELVQPQIETATKYKIIEKSFDAEKIISSKVTSE
ncbi:MAG: hypothetical protein GEV07_10475 [Streptosporangiales bacterium]|nr:hypothetical protein [Streptosporangiales bacterium]